MHDEGSMTAPWRVEYTDNSIHDLADKLGCIAMGYGGLAGKPTLLEGEATLGTPTVILTILVTSLSKVVVVAGLRLLQQELKDRVDPKQSENLEVQLLDETAKRRKKWLIQLSKVTIDETFSKVIKFVESV